MDWANGVSEGHPTAKTQLPWCAILDGQVPFMSLKRDIAAHQPERGKARRPNAKIK